MVVGLSARSFRLPCLRFPLIKTDLFDLHDPGVVDDDLHHPKMQGINLVQDGLNPGFLLFSRSRLGEVVSAFHASIVFVTTPL